MANFFTKQLKRLFLFISISLSLAANGQIKFFMAQTGSVASPPGSTVRKEAEAFDTYNTVRPYTNDDADASLYIMGDWDNTSDYADYGITTAAAGAHNVSFRVSSSVGGGTFNVKNSVGAILATITVPAGGAYSTVTQSITLASGTQTIRIQFASGGFNLNWFEVDNSLPSLTVRMAYINLTDQYTGSPELNGSPGISIWNTLTTDGTNLQTAGGFVNTSLMTDHLVKWGWGITNVTALTGVGGGVSTGSNSGVFDDQVESKTWRMTDGNQIKFTGLNPAKTYTVYALFGSVNYEPNTVSFTINSTTSPTRTTANNYGDRATYPLWSNDPALISVAGQAPTSGGDLVMTFNLISGTYIPLEALVIRED